MFSQMTRQETVLAAGVAVVSMDAVVGDVYRAALCLTTDEQAASELTEQAMADAVASRGFNRNAPATRPVLKALATAAGGLPEPLPLDMPGPDGDTERAVRAFRCLPREVRLPAVLYFTQSLTGGDVADVLGTTVQSVRARLSLARRLLADTLAVT